MSRRILITGAFGFVGKYLMKELLSKSDITIYAISRTMYTKEVDIRIIQIIGDLRDPEFVLDTVKKTKPDYVIHLAAESSVAFSWQHPNTSFQNNVNIYLNLLEALRKTESRVRLMSIGSSEEYGVVSKENIPISENTRPNPISPYAVARLAQSELSKVYANGYGLDIVLTRSFNHFGEGQTDRFVIPSFIKKVLNQKESNSKTPILVGDLSIVRDFLHVKDVVRAYVELLTKGKSGVIYNVCSGIGVSLEELLLSIYSSANIAPNFNISSEFIRPSDNPVIIGDNSRLKESTHWQPRRIFSEEIDNLVQLAISV